MDIKFELKPKQRLKLAEEIGAALHTIPCYQKNIYVHVFAETLAQTSDGISQALARVEK